MKHYQINVHTLIFKSILSLLTELTILYSKSQKMGTFSDLLHIAIIILFKIIVF